MKPLHKYAVSLELDKILEQLASLACCEQAAEMARAIRPSSNLETVQKELQRTDAAFVLSARFGTPGFHRIADPAGDLKRAVAGSVLRNRELLNIAAVYRQCRVLEEWRQHCEQVSTPLDPYFDHLADNRYLEQKISRVILSDTEIDDDASAELSAIRRKIRANSQKVRDLLDRVLRGGSQKYLQEGIITQRDGRYVVPVKAEYRHELPGLVHDVSSSGATLFVEPMSVVETNNEIRVLQRKEQEEMERILAELSAECADNAEAIENNFRLILHLNLYFCKGNLGAKMHGVIPKITDSGRIRLVDARHPLIPANEVVPISLELGCQFDRLIVTGPNTGGKTVALKTTGLLTLMAMCGLMIPAGEQSELSVFDHVLVDIGDEQSIEQSLSTFSAHMTNLISILKLADDRSLVLADELGSGTDPVEGAALAVAIIEDLAQKGAKLIATTHYAEIKAYAIRTPGVENASCEFDLATLRPTYRLLIGVPGRSNAFEISRRLGLEESVLTRAAGFVSEQDREFEEVVAQLEQARQQAEGQERELKQERIALNRLRQELEQRQHTIDRRAERELEAARTEAKALTERVQMQANRLLDEIDALRKAQKTEGLASLAARARSQMRSGMRTMYEEANPVDISVPDEDYQLPRSLQPGDQVLIADLKKQAEVLEIADRKGMVMVQMGVMKTRVPEKNLRLLAQKKAKRSSTAKRTVKSNAARSGATELDLRGCNAEEALLLLDRFIDSSVLANIPQISIIHGKGTGVLRKAVQNHLKRHPNVASYRLGSFGEGENGVTIAELK